MVPAKAVALALIVLLAAVQAGAADRRPLPVDLELVIAVDVSASMDRREFALQRFGYVEAIRHPDFIRAVLRGDHRRIALSYVEWSKSSLQRVVMPWRVIDGPDSARAFADDLAGRDILQSLGTSISAALDFGARSFDAEAFASDRRVIDISGDGPNNYGRPVTEARADAVAEGIVINGLPILIAPSPVFPAMDRYYSDCVIGGPGAFVLPIYRAEEFAVAIRRKLILEVAGGPVTGSLIPVAATPPVDCLIGERIRKLRTDQYLPGLDG
jgi:Protein of unknown function (DUF1194)